MFLRTKTGLINTRHVVGFRMGKPGVVATTADDQSHELSMEFYELELMLEAEAIVPAEPGYTVMIFHCDVEKAADTGWVQREPVLAWRIHKNYATAVTVDPYIEPLTIRRPDGTVTDPWDRDWDNEQEWLECMKKEHEERRERRRTASRIPADVGGQ